MEINKKIAEELGVGLTQVNAAVRLIDEGCTIPFIARYRREATGALNDEQLRALAQRLSALKNLEERREKVLLSIEEQGKLTEKLREAILAAETAVALDDIYRPYRPKRSTRATAAAERGLTGLADIIWAQRTERSLEEEAHAYISAEKGVNSTEEAIAGACDILAERFADAQAVRSYVRRVTEQRGELCSEGKKPEESSVYEMYYHFQEPLARASGYRVLAMNRGEKEKLLRVKIEAPEEEILNFLKSRLIRGSHSATQDILARTVEDCYARLVAPSVERELRNGITERAEDGAIQVFRKNLHQLLMQPPIVGEVVLGWDPAFRTGCKLAVVDATGKVLDTALIFPTAPTNERKQREAAEKLKELFRKYRVTLISVGNGTASRESEQFLAGVLKEFAGEPDGRKIPYVITNEAGASVYSASALATEEFPEFDVGQRSAASIARRVQDPLAELVKIDPQSIGVGQYQHDMDQKKLGEALGAVVEDCVNTVGVDLNTASAPLLQYVSGITRTTARNIVRYREEHGRFTGRAQLLKVAKLGPKAYEQCAGFLRISGGEEALDGTGVHPESYQIAELLLSRLGISKEELAQGPLTASVPESLVLECAAACGVGRLTVEAVLKELKSAGRDPRDEMPKPILKSDVLSMEDLRPGMVLRGTVRNVIDFGAFVDIGVHQDGLVHISRLSKKRFVKHPLEVVSVGDIVDVKVVELDISKKRIGLSMILE